MLILDKFKEAEENIETSDTMIEIEQWHQANQGHQIYCEQITLFREREKKTIMLPSSVDRLSLITYKR
jgi:hypothetical protein